MRKERAFWARATSADSFTLDGGEYSAQAVADGANVAEGDAVLVAPTAHGLTPGRRRQMVILQSSHGATRRGRSRPYFSLGAAFGIWQQAEGNPYLSQSGQTPVGPLTGVSSVLDLEGSGAEEFGMDRLLGITYHEGFYFLATYVGNATLDGYNKLRIRAYTFGPDELAWTVDFELDPEFGELDFKFFRANFFFDKDNRVLTVAHKRLWSLQLDTAWAPVGDIVETAFDAQLAASIVGAYGLIESFDDAGMWRAIVRNETTLEWSTSADSLDVAADLGGFDLNRPWPYNPSNSSWHLINNPATLTPDLALISKFGALTTGAISVPDSDPAPITSLLDAADTQFETEGTTGGAPYPYQEPTWDDPPGGGDIPNFDHVAWAGRYPTPTVDPNTRFVFVCPRRGGSVNAWFRWADVDDTGECAPCLRVASSGKAIYAAIEPIRYLTAGAKRTNDYIDTGTIPAYACNGYSSGVPIQRWFIDPPELVSEEEALENGGFYDVSEPGDAQLLNYEDSHQAKLVHGHRTMLRSLNSGGSTDWELDLSSGPFVGVQTFSATAMTEELPWPENVHEIKLGPKGTGFDYEDAIFLVQDRRTDRDAAGSRPCFRFVSKTGEIRSTVMCSPGSLVEPSLIEIEETFTAEITDQPTYFLSNIPAQEMLSMSVNDVPQDISDGLNNFLAGSGDAWYTTVPVAEGDTVKLTYTYLENPSTAGQYEWAVSGVAMAVNIGAGDGQKFALLGIYSDSIVDSDTRTDLYILDLNDPDDVTIYDTLTEINGSGLPRQNDFDRMTFTPGGIYYIGNIIGFGYRWLQIN